MTPPPLPLLAVSSEYGVVVVVGETAKVRWRWRRWRPPATAARCSAVGGGGMTDVVLGGTAGDDEDDVDGG